MLRSSPFWIAALSIGSVTSVVYADNLPCPSSMLADNTATPPKPAAPDAKSTGPKASTKDSPISLTSDQATLGVEGNATLTGNVDIKQADREIKADQVQYDQKTGAIKSQGAIDYTDPLVHVTGDGGDYTPDGGAEFKAAQFELRERTARGSADAMQLTAQGIIDLKGVRFTTCPASDDSWSIRAKDISLDTRNRVGTGHDAQIDFEGVPLLYLPWLSFPLGDERKSGFLFPSIGESSRSGAQVAAPYYWNIAPNADFTFEPIIYSRRGADLGGDLRLLTASEHSELSWNYLPYDSVYGNSRSRVRLENVTELPDNFRFSIDATNVSDSQYFEDFSQNPEGTSLAFVDRRAALSYRDEHWRIDGEAQQYQTIDNTLAPIDRPYARVPSLTASADYGFGPGEILRYGFDSEVVDFQRDVGVVGWRMDLMPTASLNIDGPGYFMRPSIGWRGTQYQLDDVAPGQDRSPSRTLPIASFDTGLLFERDPDSWGRKLTLEPRLLYLYVPYRNQNSLPVFDTALPDLNLVELFRTNRYVGDDRMADANQVSVGMTSRLLDAKDGRQFISATLGQTYYFQPPRVTLPGEPLPSPAHSDLVGQLTLSAFKNWNADFDMQWDPATSQSEREEINVQYRPSGEQVVNLAYRYQRDLLEQAEISAAWPINDHWNVFVRGVYSLRDGQSIERFAGFQYSSCCWRLKLLARRYVSTRPTDVTASTGQQDTSIFLQLELIGLASVGSAADSFLTEAIRGYSRPVEPSLVKTPGL